jgi:hypothetical protein
MKYERPEVTAVASAAKAIQQDLPTKPSGSFVDHISSMYPQTNGAYQADE